MRHHAKAWAQMMFQNEKKDEFIPLAQTCGWFLAVCMLLALLWVKGRTLPEPMASNSLTYIVGAAFLVKLAVRSLRQRFPGYYYSLASSILLVVAVFDGWSRQGKFSDIDVGILCAAALLLMASVVAQGIRLGNALVTKRAAYDFSLFLGVPIMVTLLVMLLLYLLE